MTGFRVCAAVESGASENEWDYALSNFEVSELYLLDCGYAPTNDMMRDIGLLPTLDLLPDVPMILLAPYTSHSYAPTVELHEFQHPEDAVYVFGANHSHTTQEVFGGREPDAVVHIPTDEDEMFNYMAFAIVAWHRRYG